MWLLSGRTNLSSMTVRCSWCPRLLFDLIVAIFDPNIFCCNVCKTSMKRIASSQTAENPYTHHLCKCSFLSRYRGHATIYILKDGRKVEQDLSDRAVCWLTGISSAVSAGLACCLKKAAERLSFDTSLSGGARQRRRSSQITRCSPPMSTSHLHGCCILAKFDFVAT